MSRERENADDMVDMTSGVLLHRMTDLLGAGRLPIVFTRTYRSEDSRIGPLGVAWRHNYALQVGTAAGGTPWRLVLPTNFHVLFDGPGGTHTATPGFFYGATFTNIGWPPSDLVVSLKDGTTYCSVSQIA